MYDVYTSRATEKEIPRINVVAKLVWYPSI
ncbi:hypothetical protein [Salmonella phage Tennessee]